MAARNCGSHIEHSEVLSGIITSIMRKLLRASVVVGLLSAWLLLTPSVLAATSNLSRAYDSDGPIEPGSIVSLTSLESKTVTLANTTNSDKIIGVAVGQTDSIIAVNPAADKVQITTSGGADVLVSDLNGDIKSGDKVAVSPFDGIGMKSGLGGAHHRHRPDQIHASSQTLSTEGDR